MFCKKLFLSIYLSAEKSETCCPLSSEVLTGEIPQYSREYQAQWTSVYLWTQCCSFSETVKMIRNGWNFKTEEDCIDFVSNYGRISSYKTCSERHLSSGCDDERSQEACCPPVWDGFLCWPPAPVNSVVEQLCPGNLPQLNHKSMQHASETSMHNIIKISKLRCLLFKSNSKLFFFL